MFKKILIAAGIATAALATLSPAKAEGLQFGIYLGDGGYVTRGDDFGRDYYREAGKYRSYDHHRDRRHYGVLTNQELRHHLRGQGLYNIRIVDRRHGVAQVVADHRRGYVAAYQVDTRNGRIFDRQVIRRGHNDHRRYGRY
ncbi:MAG: hypothetical protein H2045_12375 [Rhizobiales bacterium]|nr:hypothetical protein [Hyphomicrobiales bacterium]